MTPACARLILSIYPPRLPFPPPTYGPAPYPLLRASDTSARLIPPEEELRASDTSARLVACARLILSNYPPPPSPPPTYGPAPYPLTSPAGYLRASDTCSASNTSRASGTISAYSFLLRIRASDSSARLIQIRASDTIYLSSSPFPPPTYGPASSFCACLIPPRVDYLLERTSARPIPPPLWYRDSCLRASDTIYLSS